MPRPRTRPLVEPCDCLECREPLNSEAPQGAGDAAARQEPPPKSLIVFADGFLQTLQVATSDKRAPAPSIHPHLDSIVREGNLGVLASRDSPQATSHIPGDAQDTTELAQLFGKLVTIVIITLVYVVLQHHYKA